MSPADRSIITRKIKLIQKDYKKLLGYAGLSLSAFLDDYDACIIAERLLEKIAGRLIDINYHILKEDYDRYPDDYKQSFLDLSNLGILEKGFAHDIAAIAGLRNILAHEYDEIDYEKIYTFLKDDLQQIPTYIESIYKYIDKHNV